MKSDRNKCGRTHLFIYKCRCLVFLNWVSPDTTKTCTMTNLPALHFQNSTRYPPSSMIEFCTATIVTLTLPHSLQIGWNSSLLQFLQRLSPMEKSRHMSRWIKKAWESELESRELRTPNRDEFSPGWLLGILCRSLQHWGEQRPWLDWGKQQLDCKGVTPTWTCLPCKAAANLERRETMATGGTVVSEPASAEDGGGVTKTSDGSKKVSDTRWEEEDGGPHCWAILISDGRLFYFIMSVE